MTKFICRQCNYEFDSEAEFVKKCPYCSKEGTVKKESSAADLVDEVSGIMEEAEER